MVTVYIVNYTYKINKKIRRNNMHVSRNKCELIAECVISEVEPKYDIYGRPTVKGIDISKIETLYLYFLRGFRLQMNSFEPLTQVFYSYLNDEENPVLTNVSNIKAVANSLSVAAEEELAEIRKNRELEEDLAYV